MSDTAGAGLVCATAVVDLTPPAGLPMGGYVARNGAVAEGTLDPLTATIIRLRSGNETGDGVTWVALDALAVDRELAGSIAVAVAAASGVTPASVVVVASHTHSGPSGWLRGIPFVAPAPGDPEMRSELVGRIEQAARATSAGEVRVWPVLTVFEVTGVGTNRLDPARAIDRTAGALRLVDSDDTVRSIVVDHGSHPTVLGHDNLRWSADWPGAARRAIAAGLSRNGSNGPVVAFLQGAAGDVSPRFLRRGQTPGEVRRIGEEFARHVLASADTPVGSLGPTSVELRRSSVSLATRAYPAPDILDQRVADAEHAWQAALAGAGEATPDERIARTAHEGALTARALATAGMPGTLDLPMSLVVVGEDAWLHLPVELFSSLAIEIRASSPFRQTRVIGYADGYAGYVVDADADADRIGGYETASSLFDQPGVRILVDASIDLLRQTHDELR